MQRIRTWVISVTEPEDKTVGWIDSLITDEKLDWEFKLWQGDGWKVLKTAEGITPEDAREIASELDSALKEELEEEIAKKYTKPASGIPKTDLANTVQNSLARADTAVQPTEVSFEKGFGTNSAQQKGRNVLALGEGAVATGEGEKISFTITSVEERGIGTTAFYVQESTEGLMHGDVLHYVKDTQEIWTYVARAENNVILVTERWTPTPTVGGSLDMLRGVALGQNSSAENAKTNAVGDNSHSEGFLANARGVAAHAEGVRTHSNGWASHAEGQNTISGGTSSHAEGEETIASAKAAHAEGENTIASGEGAHAEGTGTQALGEDAHAEGTGSQAKVDFSHAEGFGTEVEAICSHAEGYLTKVDGEAAQASHTEGYMTEVKNMAEHAEGRCNKSNTVVPVDPSAPTPEEMGKATLHSVGMGYPTDPNDPSTAIRMNAFEIMQNGDTYVTGVGGYNGINAGNGGVQTLQKLFGGIGQTMWIKIAINGDEDGLIYSLDDGDTWNDLEEGETTIDTPVPILKEYSISINGIEAYMMRLSPNVLVSTNSIENDLVYSSPHTICWDSIPLGDITHYCDIMYYDNRLYIAYWT